MTTHTIKKYITHLHVPHHEGTVRLKAMPPILFLDDSSLRIGATEDFSITIQCKNLSHAKHVAKLLTMWFEQHTELNESLLCSHFPDPQEWNNIVESIMTEFSPHNKLRDWVEVIPPTQLRVLIYGRGPVTDYLDEQLSNSRMYHHTVRQSTGKELDLSQYHLVVLSDSFFCDQAIYTQLMHHKKPHIYVSLQGATINVGPTVLPGATACQRCHAMHKAESDPSYPSILAQSTMVMNYRDPALAAVAGSFCLREINYINAYRMYRGECQAPITLNTIYKIRVDPYSITTEKLSRHALCSCNIL